MRIRAFLFCLSIGVAVFSAPLAAIAQSDLTIYANYQLQSGFQDWSWNCTRDFANGATYQSPPNSMRVTMTSSNSAVWFYHGGLDTSSYGQLTFWVNGGFSGGGQRLEVLAVVYDPSTGGIPLAAGIPIGPLIGGLWQQVTIRLSDLGLNADSFINGFWIRNTSGSALTAFYVDDVKLLFAPPPAVVHISVNPSNVVRKADARWLGLNTAAWDSYLDSAGTVSALTDIGTRVLRWPGGSWGDVYHGMNEGSNTGASGSGWPRTDWGSYTTNFIHVATNIHAQAYIIANYGSSTPQEAADWLRFCNVTNHAGFKYWEIGNENFGSWEQDDNTTAPYQPHDPWTYAMRFQNYYTILKTVDPTVKIGAVGEVGEDAYANNNNHVAINSRTGAAHFGWTPVMLATLKQLNVTPDFLITHYYPEYQSDSDPTLLQAARNWASDARSLRQMLNDYLGPAGTNVEIVCTENNADSGAQGRQSTSLVNALYLADSLSRLMKTEINAFIWWDLRNGPDTGGDFNAALYGWRGWGDLGIMYANSIFYPTYYSLKLMNCFVGSADSVLSAASDYSLLASYAVRQTNGDLSLLVINKSLSLTQNGQVQFANFLPAPASTIRFYGIPQDDAARTGIGSPDIATNSFTPTGTNFTFAFPPYSLTLFTFPPYTVPEAPQLAPLPVAQQPLGKFVFQLQGQQSYPYVTERSTNLISWTRVSTNTVAGTPFYVTNTVPAGSPRLFWRSVWRP